MSADYDYFHRIPLAEYAYQRENRHDRVRPDDLESGMIVRAYSTNRHLISNGEAVAFIAELQLPNDTSQLTVGLIAARLAIRSWVTLEPMPVDPRAVRLRTESTNNDAPLLWTLTGRFPFRTAQFGIISTGFLSYWADDDISELDMTPRSPEE